MALLGVSGKPAQGRAVGHRSTGSGGSAGSVGWAMVPRMLGRLLLSLGVWAATLGVVSAAPDGYTSSLQFQVQSADTQAPLAQVLIQVRSPSLEAAREVRSDATGQALLEGLPPGEMTVVVVHPGHAQWQRTLRLRLDRRLTVRIDLLPNTGPAPSEW